MLLVVDAEPSLRGFTALCQRVASAMSDGAEVVQRRAIAQARLTSENAALAERLRTDIVTGVASRSARAVVLGGLRIGGAGRHAGRGARRGRPLHVRGEGRQAQNPRLSHAGGIASPR